MTASTHRPETVPESLHEERLDARFRAFAKLWFLATLFHQSKPSNWTAGPAEAVLTFTAIALLLGRVTVPRFALFLAVQALTIFHQLPEGVSNHWIFSFFIALTGLSSIIYGVGRRRDWNLRASEWFDPFVVAVRIQVLILYVFVVLHKLNVDFLDLDNSCAVDHYLNLTSVIPFLPQADWARVLAIVGTLAIEAGIPVLLVFRRTRLLGVFTMLIFHTVLGVNNFFDFTGMIVACMVLFLPYDFSLVPQRVRQMSAGLSEHLERRNSTAGIAGVLASAAALTFLLGLLPRWASSRMGIAIGVIYSIVLFVFFVVEVRRRRSYDHEPVLRRVSLAHAGVMILLVVNGFAPYLGLKTESSFAMFSNIRTEGNRTNHLFIPNYQPFDFQKELVRPIESNDPRLSNVGKEGKVIPYYALIRRLQQLGQGGRDVSVTYLTADGRVHSVSTTDGSRELQVEFPYLAKKLLTFRPVDTADGVRCSH